MKYLANILTSSNNIEVGNQYKICHDVNDIELGLPTLIIGFDLARTTIKNFNILNKSYPDQQYYWTFKKSERRDEYEKDLLRFTELVKDKITDNVKYEYIDIINMSYSRLKKLINYIKGNDDKIIYYYKGFVFIYSKRYRVVWGLSINLCEFIGIKRSKITSLISSNPHNETIDYNKITSDMRRYVSNNQHLLLPLYETLI